MEYIIFFSLLGGALILALKHDYSRPATDQNRDKCESPIERRLYDTLRNNGYVVTTQVQEGPYRIDIALRGAKIAIECDGKAYHSSPSQKAHDRKKDAYLRTQGWKVLRFPGSRIYKDPKGIIKRIDKEVMTHKLTTEINAPIHYPTK